MLISCCQNWFGWDRILEVDFGGNNHGFPLLYLFFFTTPLHTFLPLSFLHRYPRLGDTRRSVGTAVASCRAEQRAAGAQTWQRMCLGVAGRCLLRADRMMLKNQPPNQMLKSWKPRNLETTQDISCFFRTLVSHFGAYFSGTSLGRFHSL